MAEAGAGLAGQAAGQGGEPAAGPPPESCEVCGQQAFKYRCPRCSKKTCSLECVQAHKVEAKCSGKRDRTAFLGRGQLDESMLLSDYRFLEEVKLADDVAKRSKPPAPKADLPAFLQSLVYQASRRGVQLHILSPGMERRRTNTTRYDGRQQLLSWRVEWNFVSAGCSAANARVDENIPLQGVLAMHVSPPPGSSMKTPELQEYADAGVGQLTVALKKERMPANATVYHSIDLTQPLRSQLQGKVVVEFPQLLVLLPWEVNKYTFVQETLHKAGAPPNSSQQQQQREPPPAVATTGPEPQQA